MKLKSPLKKEEQKMVIIGEILRVVFKIKYKGCRHSTDKDIACKYDKIFFN